jgi:asparagine synthase (glutamine-hydrolysing)
MEDYFKKKISNSEFASKCKEIEKENVRIRTKEHLFYYTTFSKYFPPPIEKNPVANKRCPDCHGSFPSSGKFCRLCGAFPVTPIC